MLATLFDVNHSSVSEQYTELQRTPKLLPISMGYSNNNAGHLCPVNACDLEKILPLLLLHHYICRCVMSSVMCEWLTCRWFCAPPPESSCETKMMIDKLDPMAVGCQRKKAKQRDTNVARSSLSFVGLGDDPFGIS